MEKLGIDTSKIESSNQEESEDKEMVTLVAEWAVWNLSQFVTVKRNLTFSSALLCTVESEFRKSFRLVLGSEPAVT